MKEFNKESSRLERLGNEVSMALKYLKDISHHQKYAIYSLFILAIENVLCRSIIFSMFFNMVDSLQSFAHVRFLVNYPFIIA
jgi:hypothetical protein